MKKVAVVTPVYNRRKTMKRLFDSLNNQTCDDFYWLIIDDGSTDDFKNDIDEYKKNAKFNIDYYYEENHGKHIALNKAFEVVESELLFIVDSDDYITNDAIKIIVDDWNQIEQKNEIGALIYLKGYSENKVLGDKFKKDHIIANDIDLREKKHVAGDKAEVFNTSLVRKYRFPFFEDEKFMGENYVWWQLFMDKNAYYINKIIYIVEYLEGGLSKSGRLLRIKCPKGGMENSRIGLNPIFPLKRRIKRAILYVCYSKFAKIGFRECLSNSGYPLLVFMNYLPGVLLYLYWKQTVLKG